MDSAGNEKAFCKIGRVELGQFLGWSALAAMTAKLISLRNEPRQDELHSASSTVT